MYQNIYYSYSGEDKNTCYLRDSVKGWQQFKYYPPVYKLDPYGEFTTLFGDKCSQVFGKWDWNDPTILEKDIQKELAVLRDLYYESDDIPAYHNTIYLDIEIEILGALTPQTIREANAKITSIALIDVNTKKKYCWIINNNIQSLDKDNKQIISCKNEKQLLSSFLDKWIELDPTIVVGYNSDFFDIPYLYFRMKKILGDDMVLYLSPIKKINDSVYNSYSPITLGGISSLDYMLLIKKYIMKEEPSYKLGDIGLKYANLGKIEYNGNLDKLFVEDPVKFIEYNLRDVEIIEKLEEKLQFIKLTILICHLCHVPYESIYYNTILNEGAILTYLKRKNIVSPNKPTTTNKSIKELIVGDEVIHQRGTPTVEGIITYIEEKSQRAQIQTKSNTLKERSLRTIRKKEGFSGGYLLDPKPGLYSYVSDSDFTSLYPSIIKSLNLGVETLVGRIVTKNNYEQYNSLEKLKQRNSDEIIDVEKLNTKTYILKQGKTTIKELIDIIQKNNLSVSASGAFYRNDITSISCEVLEDWFKKREYYRSLKKKAGNNEDWENYKLYDLYQLAFKILQNALYGTYAINGWRYTDGFKICSASITNSGQRLTKESIIFINNYLKCLVDNGRDEFVIASDTDSAYIELKDLLQKLYPNIIDEDLKIEKLIELAQDLQTQANKNLDNISKNLFNIYKKHYFELKQEVIVKKAYWSGKRRYAMFIVNKEGVPIPPNHKDAFDIKGLDIMKSNFPDHFRKFGEELIKKILFDTPKVEIDKFILDFKKSLDTVDWKKLLKPTGLKKIKEYIASPPKAGEIFSKLEKKCPVNTKAAIYTSDLLKFKNLDKKYHPPQLGDKIYIVSLKQNPYHIDVIALNGYNDAPILLEFAEKYIDREGLFNSIIKNKLENMYNDLNWGGVILNQNVNKFFKF